MDYIAHDKNNANVKIDDNMQKILDKYIDDLKKSKITDDVSYAYWKFYWDFQQVLNDKVRNR